MHNTREEKVLCVIEKYRNVLDKIFDEDFNFCSMWSWCRTTLRLETRVKNVCSRIKRKFRNAVSYYCSDNMWENNLRIRLSRKRGCWELLVRGENKKHPLLDNAICHVVVFNVSLVSSKNIEIDSCQVSLKFWQQVMATAKSFHSWGTRTCNYSNMNMKSPAVWYLSKTGFY